MAVDIAVANQRETDLLCMSVVLLTDARNSEFAVEGFPRGKLGLLKETQSVHIFAREDTLSDYLLSILVGLMVGCYLESLRMVTTTCLLREASMNWVL